MAQALLAAGLAGGCIRPKPFDYGPFLDHMPRSVLVLPPLNESPEAAASDLYLPTVTRALAERGYYVFPIVVVDRMMKENGLPTPGEMHQVPLTKLREVFGADAVLYLTVTDWGTSYRVLESRTTVTVVGRLVDIASGTTLWQGQQTAIRSSNQGNQGGLIGALVGAAVNQVLAAAFDPSQDLARQANVFLFTNTRQGLLLGPRHPGFAAEQQEKRAVPRT